MREVMSSRIVKGLVVLSLVLPVTAPVQAQQTPDTFQRGDVFAAVADGKV